MNLTRWKKVHEGKVHQLITETLRYRNMTLKLLLDYTNKELALDELYAMLVSNNITNRFPWCRDGEGKFEGLMGNDTDGNYRKTMVDNK